MYRVPKLIDTNAKSVLIRDKSKLLIIGRCVEIEHPKALKDFKDYAILSVCLEEEHMNNTGLKLAAILARGNYSEVSVLTVDGSPHCVQLHFMVEEVFKIMKLSNCRRRHFVIEKGKVIEVSLEAVRVARYLSKVQKLLGDSEVVRQ